MPRFRKRPIVVEAEQYFPWRCVPGVRLTGECGPWCDWGGPHVHSARGVMCVRSGDWIVTGTRGELYVCEQEGFEAIYEAVDAEKANAPR